MFSVQAFAALSILHAPVQPLHDADDEYDEEEEEDDDDDRNLICLDLNNDQDYKSMAKIRVLLENETHGVQLLCSQWVEQHLLDAHCLETFPRLLLQTHRQLATEEKEEEKKEEEEEEKKEEEEEEVEEERKEEDAF